MTRRPATLRRLPVEPAWRGQWCRLLCRVEAGEGEALPYLTLVDEGGAPVGGDLHPRPARDGLEALAVMPLNAAELRLMAAGPGAATARAAALSVTPLPRWKAAAHLVARRRGTLGELLRRPWPLGPAAARARLRQVLGAAAHGLQAGTADYATWVRLFDTWSDAATLGLPAPFSVAYLVLSRDAASEPLAATLRSLAGQHGGAPPHLVLTPSDGHGAEPDLPEADYLGILQAGEVLAPHATRAASAELGRLGLPEIAVADMDHLGPGGARHDPEFRPEPGHALMLSGTLSRGLWLARRGLVKGRRGAADWAEAVRLRLWLDRYAAGAASFSARIPHILCHRRPDAEAAPPALLAGIVERHLATQGIPLAPEVGGLPALPLVLHALPARDARIAAIIPSTLRHPDSLRCIRAVAEGTAHEAFELHVAVSGAAPPDEAQRRAAAELERLPRVRVHVLEAPRFNFAWVNNRIAERILPEHLLLLNDDVSPIDPGWLRAMAAWMADPRVAVVGAKLLYPEGRVQHAGLLMGVGEVCEHAHRYLPAGLPGYAGRAALPGAFSAVTGACLLVRRKAWEALGGMDERYPSAFNDVDLCLRAREAGGEVVLAAGAVLHHHELRTYGAHYAGERSAAQMEEVGRMRARWAPLLKADPFHSPNLAREPGREWTPAFPPRADLDWHTR